MTSLADVENPDKALVEFWEGATRSLQRSMLGVVDSRDGPKNQQAARMRIRIRGNKRFPVSALRVTETEDKRTFGTLRATNWMAIANL
jgi:hypothetical protein